MPLFLCLAVRRASGLHAVVVRRQAHVGLLRKRHIALPDPAGFAEHLTEKQA